MEIWWGYDGTTTLRFHQTLQAWKKTEEHFFQSYAASQSLFTWFPRDPSTFLGSVWGIIHYSLEGKVPSQTVSGSIGIHDNQLKSCKRIYMCKSLWMQGFVYCSFAAVLIRFSPLTFGTLCYTYIAHTSVRRLAILMTTSVQHHDCSIHHVNV